MRITEHPILQFKKGRVVKFQFDGKELEGFDGEMISSALMANGVKVFRHSRKLDRPRGFFCAIGRCASCNMVVDGVPNVRVCVTPLREGMTVETQKGKGVLRP
jgi:predicted molibdopterin-dependent oxidoreductase YjgC